MTAVIILILLGIFLFLVEFLLLPGITVALVGAVVMTISGVYLAFIRFGTNVGVLVLLFTLIASLIIFAFSLRAKTWKRAMLNTNIDSNVTDEMGYEHVHEGDKGETIGRLAPTGMIRINNHSFEAKSNAGFLDPRTAIEIVKINGSQIIVKPIK
jgi:membrane-bound ClpP family serine protease